MHTVVWGVDVVLDDLQLLLLGILDDSHNVWGGRLADRPPDAFPRRPARV